MLADRTKFTGNPPTGPKQLHAMASAAFWTNAFRGFFTETDGLNTFNPLFGVDASIFCFQYHFSTKKLGWDGVATRPVRAIMRKDGL